MSSNTGKTLVGTGSYLIGVILFIGCIVISFYYVGRGTASGDNKAEIDKAITTISYANGGLIILMTLLALSYLRAYPDTRDNYMFIMTHVTLFLSLLAVSIAVISKRAP